MYPPRYFADRAFAARYFPPGAAGEAVTPDAPGLEYAAAGRLVHRAELGRLHDRAIGRLGHRAATATLHGAASERMHGRARPEDDAR